MSWLAAALAASPFGERRRRCARRVGGRRARRVAGVSREQGFQIADARFQLRDAPPQLVVLGPECAVLGPERGVLPLQFLDPIVAPV
jgi:hypothetical protein